MRLPKCTDVLPPDILQQFEQTVATGKRSAVIAELLHEWLDKQRQVQLRRDVIEGCREMADVYLEIEQAYPPLEEEVHRGLDAQPQTRRRRAHSA